ncbi:hypothetical protein BGZ70_004128 [Mortierella alpina]|uniref:Uncharacterized protein n=1 Tax=Mortierella alpina TaxID=64518 RepID=A0A9P6M510_MORAP|nr:hypothetical protein BGZ70_004128 [Mortierella alpina]
MSHFDKTTGGKGSSSGAFDTAATSTPQSSSTPSSSSPLHRPEECETFYRREETRNEITAEFRSKVPLEFVLQKDQDPLSVIDVALDSFGSIYASDICNNLSGYGVKLFLSDLEQYIALRKGGLDLGEIQLRPMIRALDRIKVNFNHVAPHSGIDDFRDIFKDYGFVVEIAKYYLMFKDKKVYTSDGFVILDRSSRLGQYKKLYPVVPAVIIRPNQSPVSTSTDYNYPPRTWTNPFAVPTVPISQSQPKPGLPPENNTPPQTPKASPSSQRPRYRSRKKHWESVVQEKIDKQGNGDHVLEGTLKQQQEAKHRESIVQEKTGEPGNGDYVPEGTLYVTVRKQQPEAKKTICITSADGKFYTTPSPPASYYSEDIFYDAVEYL